MKNLLIAIALACGLTYAIAPTVFSYAEDGGTAPSLIDAGALDGSAIAPAETPKAPDPIDQPRETTSMLKEYWQRGGWQFTVIAAWLIAAFFHKRLEPEDEDGDGKPDPHGWKGRTWAISGALLLVLVPLAAMVMKLEGASLSVVAAAVPTAIVALMSASNPKKG